MQTALPRDLRFDEGKRLGLEINCCSTATSMGFGLGALHPTRCVFNEALASQDGSPATNLRVTLRHVNTLAVCE